MSETTMPGLELAECAAEPRHPRVYFEEDPDAYPAPCMYCAYASMYEAHAPCEHSHHGRWRRWKLTRRTVSRLYALGLVRGSTTAFTGHCNGCVSRIDWGFGGPYVLGLPRETWRCLRAGHRPGDPIAFGYCSKCLPCTSCGSKTAGHEKGCSDA